MLNALGGMQRYPRSRPCVLNCAIYPGDGFGMVELTGLGTARESTLPSWGILLARDMSDIGAKILPNFQYCIEVPCRSGSIVCRKPIVPFIQAPYCSRFGFKVWGFGFSVQRTRVKV